LVRSSQIHDSVALLPPFLISRPFLLLLLFAGVAVDVFGVIIMSTDDMLS
jgi:hypothetical protein